MGGYRLKANICSACFCGSFTSRCTMTQLLHLETSKAIKILKVCGFKPGKGSCMTVRERWLCGEHVG